MHRRVVETNITDAKIAIGLILILLILGLYYSDFNFRYNDVHFVS